MSSRLFSGGERAPEVTPIAWRQAGGSAPAPQPGGMRRAGAQPHPEESVEARVHAAYNRGVADGEATAQQKAGALAAPVLSSFGNLIRELAAARQNARKEAEESMVKLALAVARRILHREMSTDPTAILGLIRSAFDRVTAREIHKLRMSPADAQIVLDNRADLAIPTAVEIIADPGLPSGSALFETTRGELDLSVQTQLEEIERGFTDLVVQRKR
jgi:flagellar assembly protein FliH